MKVNDKAEKFRTQYEMFMKSKKAEKEKDVSVPANNLVFLPPKKVERNEKK